MGVVFDNTKIAGGFAQAPTSRGAPPVAAAPPPPPDDEDEEVEEEEGREVGPLPPIEAYVAPPVPDPKPRDARQGMGNVGTVEGKRKWVHSEADLLWGEMLAYMQAAKRSPYEFGIAITRHDEQSNRLANIDGGTVLGSPPNTGPGEALLNAVINRIHIPSGVQTPMHYRCIFYVKRTSAVFGIGHVQLPAVSEIMQMRRAQLEAAATNPPQAYYPPAPPQGYGPGSAQPPPPQQYPQQPQGYYQPQPPQQGLGADPAAAQILQELAAIRAESAYQRGMVDEVMRAGREGRQPDPSRAPAPPPPVPPPAAGVGGISEDVLSTIVTRVVNAMGGPRPQAPPPAPPPATAPPAQPVAAGMGGIADMIQQTMVASLTKVVQMGAAQMERNVAESLRGAAGLGAPPAATETDDDEPPPEVVPQEDPRDALPFRAIEMSQTWGDGRKVVYAKDLESGQPTLLGANVMGVLMTNPFLIEKLSEGVNAIMVQGAEALKRVTTSSVGARPMPPQGLGGPQQTQQLQAAPPQAPPPLVQSAPPAAVPQADTVKRAVQSGWEA
jgi:hypothetical protein